MGESGARHRWTQVSVGAHGADREARELREGALRAAPRGLISGRGIAVRDPRYGRQCLGVVRRLRRSALLRRWAYAQSEEYAEHDGGRRVARRDARRIVPLRAALTAHARAYELRPAVSVRERRLSM